MEAKLKVKAFWSILENAFKIGWFCYIKRSKTYTMTEDSYSMENHEAMVILSSPAGPELGADGLF